MVLRKNKNNAYAKFGEQTKSFMVFSELAYRTNFINKFSKNLQLYDVLEC